MTSRPAIERIEILRRTLRQMEADPYFDPVDLLELKRIVLTRIAELELESALEPKVPALSTSSPVAA